MASIRGKLTILIFVFYIFSCVGGWCVSVDSEVSAVASGWIHCSAGVAVVELLYNSM